MTRLETLARSVELAAEAFDRWLPGFDDTNRTRQADGLPNHLVWSIGHCALYINRVAGHLDGAPLPPSDFAEGERGSADAFAAESVSYSSRPQDDPSNYPTIDRSLEIYRGACERLASVLRETPDERLDDEVDWGSGRISVQDLVLRICMHSGTHVGQLIDLRRALGLGSIFGG
jgi:hypothetical protein